MKPLILASKSPRRKELLSLVVPAFDCIPACKEEVFEPGDIDQALKKVAAAKGKEVFASYPDHVVLSADTIVVDGNQILGKPEDKRQASQVLHQLSGRWHEVKTGVAMFHGRTMQNEVITTKVHFRNLSDEEIEAYVQSGGPLDKAGSYGIQDVDFVDQIEGSYSNVVGLPMELVESWLKDLH
ncbi:septum formation protein Maf [Erysipelotrichaceae bacterium RD49]|nr:septum formation protein Maf [Erysipelotrichaceae bacterium RD49]